MVRPRLGPLSRISRRLGNGNILRESGRLAEAIASYDIALRLEPAYPEALRTAALVLRDLGRHTGALEFLNEALRLWPDFVEALNDRGNVLQVLERFSEAVDFDEALRIAPGLAQAWSNRGNLLLKMQQPEAALAAFDKALKLRSHNHYAEALCGRAVALKYLRRFDGAGLFRRDLGLRSSHQIFPNESATPASSSR